MLQILLICGTFARLSVSQFCVVFTEKNRSKKRYKIYIISYEKCETSQQFVPNTR